MSGLFRRLAERASGQRTPMLQAWVLPVFWAGDDRIEDEPLTGSPPITVAPVATEMPVTLAVPQPTPEPSFIRSEQPAAPLVFPDIEPPEPAPNVAPSTPITRTHSPLQETHIQPTAPQIKATPATAIQPPPRLEPAATQASPAMPIQLLMPAPAHTDPPRPAALFTPPPAPPAPDEIHVHIGRIEVTAIREPAPAKPGARKPQPTLSLDDYLAKRRGQQSRGEPT
ncbi:MAG: hypothetical protein JWP80_3231 [Pseudomonas sp.]|nr:hypothetical protein [Pseudomonas sp.]